MKAIMIFIDGIGLGSDNNDSNNPFVYTATPGLDRILGGRPLSLDGEGCLTGDMRLLALDPCLGIPGLPQSATGQTALFTGVNAPEIIGKHLNHYPNESLKDLLRSFGIFQKVNELNLKASFLNAYRPEFFEKLEAGLTDSYSCSTMLTYYAGLPFRTLEDLRRGQAVYMDITNNLLENMGYPMDQISPTEAARRLLQEAAKSDFLLFEYFLSDLVGHMGDPNKAEEIVKILDEFLGEVVKGLDFSKHLLVVTSDHGNLEEINHPNHTRNMVPCLLGGPEGWLEKAGKEINDITGPYQFILNLLSNNN